MVGILYWLQALKTDHHQRRLIVSFLLFGVTAMSIRLLLLQSFILAIGKPPLLLPIESEAFPLYFSLQCCVFIRLFVSFRPSAIVFFFFYFVGGGLRFPSTQGAQLLQFGCLAR